MSRSRMPLVIGAAAVGGVGYYLYNAGGSPKAAEKQFESDLHKAAGVAKAHKPGSPTDAKQYGAKAGAKFDDTVAEADRRLAKAKEDAEAYAKEAKAKTIKKIDEFDRKVEDASAKAKGGISSWFGGK